MELSALAGNRRLKEQLAGQEEGRGLSHAYILSGPAGSGKHTLARLLCAAMLCAAPAGQRPCGRCGPCRNATGWRETAIRRRRNRCRTPGPWKTAPASGCMTAAGPSGASISIRKKNGG